MVVDSVKPDGWAVLNAEDENCVKIGNSLRCNVAYYSLNEDCPVIKEHCEEGGVAAIYENGFITIKKGDWKIRIERATLIPLTMNGKALFNIANVLAATLAAYLQGFKTEGIRLSLSTFLPSAAQTPGRLNVFEFSKFKLLLVYLA